MQTVKIKELVSFVRGVSYKKEQASKENRDQYTAILRANNISDGDFNFDELIFVPSDLILDRQMISKGDIVITMSSGSKAHVGKVAIATHNINAAFGAFCAKIVPEKIVSKYLYYVLRSTEFRRHIEIASKGTNINNIKQDYILDYEICLPSLEEQERIVAKIEELFSELDNGVETLKKTKQQLAVYRQAVLKEAFASSTASYRSLEDLCFFITKGTTPAKSTMTAGSGEIPFIKVYNLTFDNTLDFSIDPTFVDKDTHSGFLGRSIVYPGDVLMNIVGPPMGKVSIVPEMYSEWNINQAIARFRCLDGLYNKYLAYFLGYSDTVEKMKSRAKATAGQFNLTLEICRDIQIPVPSIEEQEKIVFDIETKLSQQQKIADTIELALQQAEAMRQSILKKAFEGEF